MEYYLDSEYIELVRLLKFQGLADTGGQSKQMIEQGMVVVNGKLEFRKRAKLRHGDIVDASGVTIRITKASE